jgi:hypothetical protein
MDGSTILGIGKSDDQADDSEVRVVHGGLGYCISVIAKCQLPRVGKS